jgi:hemerythrin
MGLKDYQAKIIRQFQAQENLLADLYAIFANNFPEDRDFWTRLVREETMHAQLVEKLYAVVEKGQMIFDEGKVKTYTLSAMIERIEALVQRARQGDFNRCQALAQALDLEAALIEKGVFTHFEPMTEKANAILKRLNRETLDHVDRVRRMHADTRPAEQKTSETKGAQRKISRLKWTKDLSVGNEGIDAQHRNMFDLINRAASLQASGGPFGEIAELIREMLRYSDEHFKTEDDLMIDSDYPLFGTHRREHLKYMETLGGFAAGLQEERQNLIEEVVDFLMVWWRQHIAEADLRYARWIRKAETEGS